MQAFGTDMDGAAEVTDDGPRTVQRRRIALRSGTAARTRRPQAGGQVMALHMLAQAACHLAQHLVAHRWPGCR